MILVIFTRDIETIQSKTLVLGLNFGGCDEEQTRVRPSGKIG